MGFFGGISSRVRNLLSFDKEKVAMSLAKGATGSAVNSGMDLMQSYGYDQVSEYLKLEQDLMSKYIDIEEMDDDSTCSSALNFYADDASATDQLTGKSVWCDSNDRTVKEIISDLFDKRLRLGEECWSQARTLCKYGSELEELLVTEDGVVGTNYLPTPTMRRIEGRRGELYGFVQDARGRFAFSPDEFKQLLAQRMGGGQAQQGQEKMTALEDWEVVHMRLQSKQRRSLMGSCLPGNSRVWTAEGLKDIRDVEKGDRIFLRHGGLLRTALVGGRVCNGQKNVFKLRTKTREIIATDNHPFLLDRGGNNNAWCELKDLKIGQKLILANKMPGMIEPPPLGIKLLELSEDPTVILTDRGAAVLRRALKKVKYAPADSGIRPLADKFDITSSQISDLAAGASSINLSRLKLVYKELGVPFFDGAVVPKVADPRLRMPDFVDAKFCRLWGFMMADGWMTDGQVYFARGMDEPQNLYYESMFEEMGLPVGYANGFCQAYVSSEALVKLFNDLGWINGAHDKRVPKWMFAIDEEYRREFIQGFMDGDGYVVGAGGELGIELCNKELVEDIKAIIDGLGWTCGVVHRRERDESVIKVGTPIALWPGKFVEEDRILPPTTAYRICWSRVTIADTCGDGAYSEPILSIEPYGSDEVYDIEVLDNGHNFVCNGFYVHNSVLESSRWVWKRLMLLEDSSLIYQLQRSPQRFVFNVDVGDMPPREAFAYLNKVRQQYKKTKFINPTTGKIDLKYNAISPDEDIFIGVRKGVASSKVDVLSAPIWQSTEILDYFKLKLFAGLVVPKTYLGFGDVVGKSSLSSEDVRFGRAVLRVQREMRDGYHKTARVHLAALNINPAHVDYEIYMTIPSSVFELAQIEVRNAKADFAGRMSQFVSLHWILNKVFGLSEEEIQYIIQERHSEQLLDAEVQAKMMGFQTAAQAQAQAAAQPAGPASGGQGGPGAGGAQEEFGIGSLSQLWPQRRQLYGYKSITEQELFRGNRDHEKRIEDNFEKIFKTDQQFAHRLNELKGLIQEIRLARPRGM